MWTLSDERKLRAEIRRVVAGPAKHISDMSVSTSYFRVWSRENLGKEMPWYEDGWWAKLAKFIELRKSGRRKPRGYRKPNALLRVKE